MDMSEDHISELEKRGGNPVNYHSPGNISSDWRFTTANVTSSSLGLVSTDNQMPICREGLVGASSCSSASMVDSFGPGLWDHSNNSQNLGYCDSIVQIHPNTSNPLEHRKSGPTSLRGGMDKGLEMGWNPPRSMLKGGLFLNGASGMIPQSLSQFPADSAFIERAARFSCFNGGNFSDMMNPFGMDESLGLYTRGGGMMQGPQEVFAASGLKSAAIGQGAGTGETSKDTCMSVEHEAIRGPLRNGRRSESAVKSNDDTKQVVGGTGNESEEVELSGHGGQEEASTLEGSAMELSDKSLGSNKRKRNGQDIELDQAKENHQSLEAAKGNLQVQQKGEQTPSSTPNRNTTGKQGKQGSQALDLQKEEYIHVRARRGQATNSHSLAERVRREKISERMKLLQDLVPGCSKVTGKAVMLDEIINYVQSLQRQVEFLSMKLATVNPRLDFNIEGLFGKDILHSRAVPSSALAFSSEMPMAYPPFNASQAGLFPAPFPGMESHSDILRRTVNSQLTTPSGGFKEPTQLPNAWDDELHNVVQMGYGANTQDGQDVNAGSLPEGGMKAEH